jgi:hypothetical protein
MKARLAVCVLPIVLALYILRPGSCLAMKGIGSLFHTGQLNWVPMASVESEIEGGEFVECVFVEPVLNNYLPLGAEYGVGMQLLGGVFDVSTRLLAEMNNTGSFERFIALGGKLDVRYFPFNRDLLDPFAFAALSYYPYTTLQSHKGNSYRLRRSLWIVGQISIFPLSRIEFDCLQRHYRFNADGLRISIGFIRDLG